ncbi:MAG: hypothetical protein AB7O93_22920 [Vicinamibacterales bacterium]
MAEKIIPDDLLRQIIGVGQVDVLLGLATSDHASTVGPLVTAARAGLQSAFSRLRVALLQVDQVSADGSQEAVLHAWMPREAGARAGLRTTHYICAATDHVPDGDVVRLMLAAGDLLQARAIVVLDADVEPEGPGEVASLISHVWNGGADLVAPVYVRGAADGLLVTQIVRPLTGAVFARRLAEPLIPAFACSGRFASHCTQAAWSTTAEQRATSYWVATEALAGTFDVRQHAFGPRRVHGRRQTRTLQELFGTVLTSAFSCIEGHAAAWLTRGDAADLPCAPEVGQGDGPPVAEEVPGLLQSFADDIRNLESILRSILAPATLAAVQAASLDPAGARYPDALWADTLTDFLAAFHHGVMRRDHITQALLPLYRARSGAFLRERANEPGVPVQAALDALAACVERGRPRLVERWTNQHEVQHG